MDRKEALIVIGILVVIASLFYLFTISISPDTPPLEIDKTYTYSGIVERAENYTDNKPEYVYIYYPYYIPEYLCRSSDVQLSRIEWLNETYGRYSTQFRVPIGLKQVMFTTSCSNCNYTLVELDNFSNQLNLKWGTFNCKNTYKDFVKQKELLDWVDDSFRSLDKEIDKELNYTDKELIIELIQRGKETAIESNEANDENKSLILALQSEWYYWHAQNKFILLKTGKCTNKITSLLELYQTNNSCYSPPYNSYSHYLQANSIFNSYIKIKPTEPRYIDNLDLSLIKRMIQGERSTHDKLSDYLRECGTALDVINNTFKFQKPYCEYRNKISKSINLTRIILYIYIGILLVYLMEFLTQRLWMRKQ